MLLSTTDEITCLNITFVAVFMTVLKFCQNVEDVSHNEPMDDERRKFLSNVLDNVTAEQKSILDTVAVCSLLLVSYCLCFLQALHVRRSTVQNSMT